MNPSHLCKSKSPQERIVGVQGMNKRIQKITGEKKENIKPR